jgi:transposase InsO family protein
MVWKDCDPLSQRLEFVVLATAEGANITQLCRRFGVSRKTGYKWCQRYRAGGVEAMSDRSRRPVESPSKTCGFVEEKVLEIRDAHPAWGSRKIRKRLQLANVRPIPAASTITAILHRHGRISSEESGKHRAFGSFEREQPNELWQVDFKGEFKLSDKSYCFPLTVLDDHSRYSLAVIACSNQQRQTVQDHFRDVFRVYGLPRAIYVDNGNPWSNGHHGMRHTRFSAWLMRHDVDVIHGRPYHPQGRGKIERFHRTLKLEALQGHCFDTLEEVQSRFDPWRESYNLDRPHESLELETPSTRYRVSEREFHEQTGAFEYSDRYEVRKTNRSGQLKFRGHAYRISEAFIDEPIGLSPTSEDGLWDVWYCRFVVGRLDERTGLIERHQPRG